jgi:hypothetical protein
VKGLRERVGKCGGGETTVFEDKIRIATVTGCYVRHVRSSGL